MLFTYNHSPNRRCYNKEIPTGVDMGGKHKDLVGMKFGRLTVESKCENIGTRRGWLCVCDCGNLHKAITYSLTCGKTTSCGCRKLEALIENSSKYGIKPRHGMTDTKVWKTWSSMLDRVRRDTRESTAKQYYSRGIGVCDRWRTFENFFEDMGHPPDGMTLDRVDVDKGYEPGNCRWATIKQQMNNKTNTRYLVVDGVKRPLMEVAGELGLKKSAAQYFFSTYRKLLESFSSVDIEVNT